MFVLCALGIGFATPAIAAPADARRTLVVVYPSDATTMNPLYASNEPSLLFSNLVFDGLTAPGPNYSIIPWLATSWTSTPDHLHWVVHLRRGVRWSDGAPFDSRDVVFTWNTMLDPKVAFPNLGQFSYVKRVTAHGSDVVHFDLSSENVLFVSQALYAPILPAHILAKIPADQQNTSPFGQHPIGTGPYVLESWHHDDRVAFVRNEHWWHGVAKIPRIEFRIILNNNARIDAMVDGSADLITSMPPSDYRALSAIAPHLTYFRAPDLYSRFIMTNTTLPGLADLAVRRAMMYGWDRRAIVDGLYHGDVLMNDTLTPWALAQWHNANTAHYPYDVAHARALLDAAGWRVGRDGVRERDHVRLAFTLKNSTGDAILVNVCSAFQADMASLGIAIEIQQLDYATFIDQVTTMHYELALSGWGGVIDPDEFTFLDSSQMLPVGTNYTGYRNAQVDRDLRAGIKAFDPVRRRAIYDDYQRIVSSTLPVLWGYDDKFSAAYSSRVRIDEHAALADLLFWWNVYDWSLTP